MTTAADVSDAAPLSAFQILLGEFLSAAGHPETSASDVEGIEFTSEDLIASIYPHPTNDQEAIIDVQIFELGFDQPEEDAQRFLSLHRLNETNRFTNGWLATISADDILLITRRLRISETNGEQLAALVADGLERAEEFAKGWTSLPNLSDGSSPPESIATDPSFRV